MDILNKIVAHKVKEVADRKASRPIKLLEQSIYFETPSLSLKQHIRRGDKSGIIAEIKRKSPSRGNINPYVSVESTSMGYMEAGASALSILTDADFFGGSNDDLMTARKFNFCPILRKDFIIDEYQLIEAKSIGADAILLIAAILEPKKLKTLCSSSHALQLEVLLEVHNEDELNNNLEALPDLIGVNNRNLRSFEVNTDVSKRLIQFIPDEISKISESGIDSPSIAADLRKCGFDGFLIGESFMKTSQPELSAMKFIKELNRLEKKKMKPIKLKVCGMVDENNIMEVASLQPDLMGFIFYESSLRFVGNDFKMPDNLDPQISKVGVFVNESPEVILDKVKKHRLDFVQLHGDESVAICQQLHKANIRTIKVFSIDKEFDFQILKPFEDYVDYFLFDTKGKLPGGNGIPFDWVLLKKYSGKTPFFLSGGINPENVKQICDIKHDKLFALDVNSGIEDRPGLKNKSKFEELMKNVNG